MQERCNSSAIAMELHLSCNNPAICEEMIYFNGLNQKRLNSSLLAMELQ